MNKLQVLRPLIAIIFLTTTTMCNSQNSSEPSQILRKPAVAGQFYTANKAELTNELSTYFQNAEKRLDAKTRAIVSPHAGYVYSGQVAASAFNQISPDAAFEHVFVITSSHRAHFAGASIYNLGNYLTPLGEVPVDIALASKLIAENKVFSYRHEAHATEHSLEVQLPFLQHHLKNPYKMIPIVIGSSDLAEIKEIANALRPYFNDKNLFVISSDFSHYPKYFDAQVSDKFIAQAITENKPKEFVSALEANSQKRIGGLSTSACGWASILTLLYLTENEPFTYNLVQYMNSGDQSFGDKSRVVGYWAISVTEGVNETQKKEQISEDEQEYSLSKEEKAQLLNLARRAIKNFLETGKKLNLEASDFTKNQSLHCGSFISLYKDNRLRGCIGRFTSDIPLFYVIQDMAIASATQDNRFSRVTVKELEDIDIEISVLSPMKKIESIDEIELGKHGIYIIKGYASGTFLPQVATDTGWSLEEFLGHCARDKAGIGWDGWKEADIYIYSAYVFGEKE